MRVTVVGAGYVGAVTAACLADAGHQVVCVERDAARRETLVRGGSPVSEPGLAQRIARTRDSGHLRVVERLERWAGVVLLCVGTPPTPDGGLDAAQVLRAAQEVARGAEPDTLIVLRSTLVPGTTARLRQTVAPLPVLVNPEFLRQGHAVHDTLHPSRVVVGGDDVEAVQRLRAVYAALLDPAVPWHVMDPTSAELAKLAANALLAQRVAFVNELAHLCETVGAHVDAIRGVLASDPRLGTGHLEPSFGFGGSCLPKDLAALEHTGVRARAPQSLAGAARRANEAALDRWLARIRHALAPLEGRRVALWGLAFKAGTDDVRSSPALWLARQLLSEGARIAAYDPRVSPVALGDLAGPLGLAETPLEAARGADALIVGTREPVFRTLPAGSLAAALARPLIFDGHNLLDVAACRRAGLAVHRVGDPPPTRVD